jgi:hypothetical protein
MTLVSSTQCFSNHEEGNCVSPAIDEDDRRKCALLWARLEEKSNDALTTEQAIAALQNGQLDPRAS